MKASDVFPSKYLSQKDLESPIVLTIDSVILEDLDGDHGVERKPIMYFREPDSKALVVNKGNWLVCEEAYGEESDAWSGKRVEIYADPNVMFGAKRVGGVRVRIPAVATVGPVPHGPKQEPFIITQLKVFIEGYYSDEVGQSKVASWLKAAGVARVEDMSEANAAKLVAKIREKLQSQPVVEPEV